MKDKALYILFKTFALLPLWLLYLIADVVTLVLYYVIKYRRDVVRSNLTSSFPQKSLKEIKSIERNFYRYLGDQMVETLKLFHISDKQLKRRVRVLNFESVNETLASKRNAVLLMGHYCNWEWVQEISRYFIPGTFMSSIYHQLTHPIWDDLYLKLRGRWGNHMIEMKKAPRVLLNRSNQPWVCGFIADAWTNRREGDNWVEFLNHQTWFIEGSEVIGDKAGADFFYLEMIKKKRGYYDIIFHPLKPQEKDQTFPHTRLFWKEFEKTIIKAPAFWLWSHKRWK